MSHRIIGFLVINPGDALIWTLGTEFQILVKAYNNVQAGPSVRTFILYGDTSDVAIKIKRHPSSNVADVKCVRVRIERERERFYAILIKCMEIHR